MTKINEMFEKVKEKLEKEKSIEETKAKNLKHYRDKYKGFTLISDL